MTNNVNITRENIIDWANGNGDQNLNWRIEQAALKTEEFYFANQSIERKWLLANGSILLEIEEWDCNCHGSNLSNYEVSIERILEIANN